MSPWEQFGRGTAKHECRQFFGGVLVQKKESGVVTAKEVSGIESTFSF